MKNLIASLLHGPWPRRAFALATLAALAACNDTPAPAASAPTGTASVASIAMARGRIEVQGGLLRLSPLQDGQVETVAVREGQQVKRGQLLLRLSGSAAQAETAVAGAELQLAEARAHARAQTLPGLRRTAARLAEAVAANAVEPQRADEAAQALRNAESDLAVARAEADVSRQRLAQLRSLQARLELHAPEDGTIVRLATQPGQRLLAANGDAAAITLLPRRPLQVRAEVNESYAAALRTGMHASVSTDSDATASDLPTARLVRMSPVLGPAQWQEDTQRGVARVVECVLEFDQPPTNARPGQAVRVAFQP